MQMLRQLIPYCINLGDFHFKYHHEYTYVHTISLLQIFDDFYCKCRCKDDSNGPLDCLSSTGLVLTSNCRRRYINVSFIPLFIFVFQSLLATNDLSQLFLITFNFFIVDFFLSPSVFLSPCSKCIKKSSNFHLCTQQKIFWVLVFSIYNVRSVHTKRNSVL